MGLRYDTARVPIGCASPTYTAHTDANAGGPLPHRAFAVLIGLDDPHPQSCRVGCHAPLLHHLQTDPLLLSCVQHK
jgi:hypothetical protein